MKRIFAIALTLVILLSSMIPAFAAANDGTYDVVATGNADGMNISVTFEGGAIKDIVVGAHNETPGLCDAAIERIPAAIVAANSVAVDVISGATNTSNGIIDGVKAAIEAAGGNVADYEVAAEAITERTERTIEADVIIAGAGIAGMSGAIAAAEAGANVILLEKNSQIGGSLSLAGGNFCSVDSAVGAEYGIDDNLEDTVTFWQWSTDQSVNPDSGFPDMERVTTMLKAIDPMLTWMKDHGVPFYNATPVGPQTVAKINTEGGGAAVAKALEAACLNAGVTILCDTPAIELIVDGGKVTGVKAQSATEELTILASKGVMLCTGGFGANPELLAEWVPGYAHAASSVASGHTGDGFLMAQAIGAAMFDDPWVMPAGLGRDPSITAAVSDASPLSYGALSNRALISTDGKRFTNEYIGGAYAVLTNAVASINTDVWYIMDSADEATAAVVEEGAAAGVIAKADTIADLAAAIGVDAATLEETITAYNAACEAGVDDLFAKDPEYLVGYAAEGPYYAVKFIPGLLGTIAGVVTDYEGHVFNTDGEIIEGLYAAGEMSNRPFYNQVYVGAASLALYPVAAQAAVADMMSK